MANSELYDKTYSVPSDVLKYIQTTLMSNPNSEGTKRAKFLLKNGVITYQSLKRLKNFFDYFNAESGDKIQYALAGGDLMRSFIERTLNANRDAVSRGGEVKREIAGISNSQMKLQQTPRLTESKKKTEVNKNALAVIVDSDNKILLLKRSDFKDQWQPNKWSLVGGGIEKGESPEEACRREIKEETGLDIDKFSKTFKIEKVDKEGNNNVEEVFACRYDGDPTEIKLNKENSNYGWYSIGEMAYLDTVPLLIQYISLVFKPY